MFREVFRREMLVNFRKPSEFLNPLVFFLVVITLFPLGIGPTPDRLAEVAPAVIWVAALLATLMSLDLMFRGDFDDGTLEQVVVSGQPMIGYILAKVLGHWLTSGLPLVLLTPVVGLVMFVNTDGMLAMVSALLLVSPTLSLLGAIGAALTVGLSRGGLLVTLLILPLYIPLLILATSMTQAGMAGEETAGYLYWLAAALCLAAGLSPFAVSEALCISVDQ